MKVELRIDPGCDGMSVVINAPALTDEVKALAARLEGGGVLVGWQGAGPFPWPRRTFSAATARRRA